MHKRSSLARLLTACVVFFVEEHISITASNTSAELAGRAALKMDCNVSAWTEAGVWLQLQDDKAISRRADPRVQSMNHTSDYSARGNRLCIVFPGQMWERSCVSEPKKDNPEMKTTPSFHFSLSLHSKLSCSCWALPQSSPRFAPILSRQQSRNLCGMESSGSDKTILKLLWSPLFLSYSRTGF